MEFIPSSCADQSLGPANSLLSTLMTALIAAHCNISSPDMWPEDYGPNAFHYGLDTYDFVVIGAGMSGSVVASRLSEDPRYKVLLIEAGGNPSMESEIPRLQISNFDSAMDWAYRTEPNGKSHLGLVAEASTYTKGKMLGGSSGLSAMFYLRGIPEDYDEWERAGNPRWGYYDVLPYFKKSEDFRGISTSFSEHGIRGPVRIEPFRAAQNFQDSILRMAQELRLGLIDDTYLSRIGFGPINGLLADGRRVNVAQAFLNVNRPNLHIIKSAEATKIEFNRNHIASSVNFIYRNQYEMKVNVRKEVISSAGSIGTPKLLMLSGIGPEIHLRTLEIPIVSTLRVGDNLQDHIRVDVFMKFPGTFNQDPELEFLDEIYNLWIHRLGPPAIEPVMGSVNTRGDHYWPEIQYFYRRIVNISEIALKAKPEILLSLAQQIEPGDRVYGVSVMFTKPESKGFVRLRSADYRDYPYITPNAFQRERDVKATERGLKQLFEFENTPEFVALKGQFLRPTLPDCDRYRIRGTKYLSCYARHLSDTVFGYCGTAKMGPIEDPGSVVDSELRVRGVKGLRVIDTSVIPRITSSLDGATAMMIGEKGADLIKFDWDRY